MVLNDISDISENTKESTEQIIIRHRSNKKKKGSSEDLSKKVYSVLFEKEDDIDVFVKCVTSEFG